MFLTYEVQQFSKGGGKSYSFEVGKLCGFQTIYTSEIFFNVHRSNGRILPVHLIAWCPSVELRSRIFEQLACGTLAVMAIVS